MMSITYTLWLIVLLFEFMISTVCSVKHSKDVIFVDDARGVEDTSCWRGGIDLPCKSWSLANEGRQSRPDVLIATLDKPASRVGASLADNLSTNQLDSPDCPLWMHRDKETGKCECSDIPYRAVNCDPTIPRTSLLDCLCMTYNIQKNQTELGRCIFGCTSMGTYDSVYHALPNTSVDLNEFMCGKENRTSTLCGKCKDGYSPLVYSYELSCMNCTGMSYNWMKYLAIAYLPLTAFFFFVILFKFSGTSPLMRAFITTCQGMTSPISIRVSLKAVAHSMHLRRGVKFLATVYGVWNLDFFRTILPPICLDISPLQALLLDYAVAFYPLMLVVISYILISLHSRDVRIVVWMWKPFKKVFKTIDKNWEIQGSIANALATFLLLSYLKVVDVSFDLLVYSNVYTLNGSSYAVTHALYYDASVEMFSSEHLPYALTAIAVMVFVIVLPLLFLVVYPTRWCQRCLNTLHIRRESVDIFVDCFQGYYKNGTNGTRDYRFFSVAMYLLQISTFCLFALTESSVCYPVSAVALILVATVILFCQPYKEQFRRYSLVDGCMLLSVACLFIMVGATDIADVKDVENKTFSLLLTGLFALIPLIYVTSLCLWWVVIKKKFGRVLIMRVRSCCSRVRGTEEDVEGEPDRVQNPKYYNSINPLSRSLNIQEVSGSGYGSCTRHSPLSTN